jgi:hypothetical protein
MCGLHSSISPMSLTQYTLPHTLCLCGGKTNVKSSDLKHIPEPLHSPRWEQLPAGLSSLEVLGVAFGLCCHLQSGWCYGPC